MKKKVCFICSAGGHLEQIRQLNLVAKKYDSFYVTTGNSITNSLGDRKYSVNDLNRRNFILTLFSLVVMTYQQSIIFIKEKPDIIITTGAGLAIPMCLIAHFMKRKVIYIESFARIHSTNASGRFLYKYTDLFIVQSEELLEFYPKGIYGGWIY